MKIGAVSPSETMITTHQLIFHHTPEDLTKQRKADSDNPLFETECKQSFCLLHTHYKPQFK